MQSPDLAQYGVASAQTLMVSKSILDIKVAHVNINGVTLLTVAELEPSAWIVESLLTYLEEQENLQPLHRQTA